MMRTNYGTMQRENIMFVGNAKRSVALFIPPLPDEALTNIANKLDHGQYFDDYAKLENHDYVVHTYCTDCEQGFDDQNELADHVLELHVEKNHHVCRECEEVGHAFHPSATRRDLNKRRKQNGITDSISTTMQSSKNTTATCTHTAPTANGTSRARATSGTI